mmetsp:Transcript_54476/g.127090  ORF Transcript_54476/g.127090 Transcript_54476/m.127090 type:complete len:111 (-) Transcript_54476:204-536(-)
MSGISVIPTDVPDGFHLVVTRTFITVKLDDDAEPGMKRHASWPCLLSESPTLPCGRGSMKCFLTHGTSCNPCIYHFRRQGCLAGSACNWCHVHRSQNPNQRRRRAGERRH